MNVLSSWLRGAAMAALMSMMSFHAIADQQVSVPSLDQRNGAPLQLTGHWFEAHGHGAQPAIVLLHGCSGAYNAKRELDRRMREYGKLLNGEGWHVLVLDSLAARGEKELCTQKTGTRAVTQANRRLDALGALQWLAARPEVDAKRLVLLGWSNGGSTVLAATNLDQRDVKTSGLKPRAAVAFYPGCEADLKRGYQPTAPILLLVGGSDDWTPPQPCVDLAKQAGETAQIEVYPGAYHGFDSTGPVRLRRDVPNGTHPGQGVHVGGDPSAREASQKRMLEFLRKQLNG